MSELSIRERTLVALGAAIGSNCVPCITYHIPIAREAGLGDDQIREAVEVADKVRWVPARTVIQTAMARIGGSTEDVSVHRGAGCGCGKPVQ